MKLLNKDFKKTNLYIILLSFFIVVWFYSITKILTVITNNSNNIYFNTFLALLALGFFYMDDNRLQELYRLDPNTNNPVTTLLMHSN